MKVMLQKWGNSRGIRIPKIILDAVQWNGNESLIMTVTDNKIIIEQTNRRKNIKELFADFHGDYVPENIDWGEPVGEEIW